MSATKMRGIVAALTKAFPEGTWAYLSKKDCKEDQTFDPPCAFIKGCVWGHSVQLTFDGELYVGEVSPEDIDVALSPTQIAQAVVAAVTAAKK